MIDKISFFDELAKVGAISDEQARASLDRLDTLERNKPTMGQVGRYAGLGAVAGPAMSLAGNLIKKGPAGALDFGGRTMARGVLGDAAKGAIGGGLVPLVRNHLDRHAEMGTLRSFVKQHELPQAAPGPAGTEVAGKIAAAQEPQEDPNVRRAGLGVAGGTAAVVGNGVLGAVVRHQATAEHAGDAATMEKMRQSASVPIHDAPHGVNAFLPPPQTNIGKSLADAQLSNMGLGGAKIGPEGAVLLGKDTRSPAILAHELGHVDVHSSRAGRAIQSMPARLLGVGSPGIGLLSGGLSGMSDDPRAHALGLAAPAIAAAPMLASEGLASIKAVRHLRNAGASGAQMGRAAKALLPAFGTYATHAGLGVANAAVAQGAVGAARDAQGAKVATVIVPTWTSDEDGGTSWRGLGGAIGGALLGGAASIGGLALAERAGLGRKAVDAAAPYTVLGGAGLGASMGSYYGRHGTLQGFTEAARDAESKAYGHGKLQQDKVAFTTSEYAGPMGTVPFQQASQLPAFKTPGLKAAIEKPQQKIAEDKEAGKLPPIFSKEKGVVGRAKQLLSGERALALKTYKEKYENQAGRLGRRAAALERHGHGGSDYVNALKRDADMTGRHAKRIGKVHSAEATKSTAARAGVVGAAGAGGFAAGRMSSDGDKEASALTPAGRLVATQRKGTGMGASVSGPSIADVAKPPRMGSPMPGALKNRI